jgi:hypothetical protein
MSIFYLPGTPDQSALSERMMNYVPVPKEYLGCLRGCFLYYFDKQTKTFQNGGHLKDIKNNTAILQIPFSRERIVVPVCYSRFYCKRDLDQYKAICEIVALKNTYNKDYKPDAYSNV